MKPRETTPKGIIVLDDILAIVSEQNIYKDGTKTNTCDRPFWFEIITKKTNYLISAESETEMKEWIEAIEFVNSQKEQRMVPIQQHQHTHDVCNHISLFLMFFLNIHLFDNDSHTDIPIFQTQQR